MTEYHEKARAIFLTVVMVLSMVGSGIAFSGGAAAQTADIQYLTKHPRLAVSAA